MGNQIIRPAQRTATTRFSPERARRAAKQILEHVASGEPRLAYHQFAMTWDEALREDRQHGGEAWEYFERAGSET